MSKFLDTPAQIAQEFDELERAISRVVKLSIEEGVKATIPKISDVTPRQTGNAARAIGVPGPILPSKSPLGGLEGRRKTDARRVGTTWVSTLHLMGMAYFPELDQKYDLSRAPVDEGGDEVDKAASDIWEHEVR